MDLVIRDRARLPAPRPGPVSLGNPGAIEAALERSGFTDVRVDVVVSPLRLPTAADCVRFERESLGTLHQMLAGVPEAERDAVWSDIEAALTRFETEDGFAGPCELLVASGSR